MTIPSEALYLFAGWCVLAGGFCLKKLFSLDRRMVRIETLLKAWGTPDE